LVESQLSVEEERLEYADEGLLHVKCRRLTRRRRTDVRSVPARDAEQVKCRRLPRHRGDER
jgi:hypothetical protein